MRYQIRNTIPKLREIMGERKKALYFSTFLNKGLCALMSPQMMCPPLLLAFVIVKSFGKVSHTYSTHSKGWLLL